ncbi:Glyoxylate/hydroxypyruvate reductase A [Dyadobacter sp. CECT 9275]|uniref:Glyoxylate/hydroxypyruvate reductase A n=1 Tax=Dyadobacter helix TaxID=2822344 RepID=A0A916JC62_9BACT|nr:D-2-hydroxyacid dehydrogenase [Dyadobacter sp. CECT 9275]CAG5000257.1 Glyoxylate/hydroxypyruvate reductase A [Dyadobacter sp. CECT 9275]
MILLMYDPVPEHFDNLKSLAPDHEFMIAHTEEEAKMRIADAEIVFGNRFFLQSLPYAKRLRWMQSNSVGVDLILSQKQLLIARDILLTCSRGVYDAELAEHTLALLLALFRNLHLLRDDQHASVWRRHRLRTLHGSKCLILGWGSLAKEIARQITTLNGQVSAVRNQKDDSVEGGITIYGKYNWHEQLAETDALIICLPKTPETYHFVNQDILEKLPADAFVVNIGRGGTLDDHVLLEMVASGRLAGAALDVFEQEPLLPSNPIWKEPRILVSPHVGRSLEGPVYKWQALFEDNLSRYMSGKPLYNVVNYQKGY